MPLPHLPPQRHLFVTQLRSHFAWKALDARQGGAPIVLCAQGIFLFLRSLLGVILFLCWLPVSPTLRHGLYEGPDLPSAWHVAGV